MISVHPWQGDNGVLPAPETSDAAAAATAEAALRQATLQLAENEAAFAVQRRTFADTVADLHTQISRLKNELERARCVPVVPASPYTAFSDCASPLSIFGPHVGGPRLPATVSAQSVASSISTIGSGGVSGGGSSGGSGTVAWSSQVTAAVRTFVFTHEAAPKPLRDADRRALFAPVFCALMQCWSSATRHKHMNTEGVWCALRALVVWYAGIAYFPADCESEPTCPVTDAQLFAELLALTVNPTPHARTRRSRLVHPDAAVAGGARTAAEIAASTAAISLVNTQLASLDGRIATTTEQRMHEMQRYLGLATLSDEDGTGSANDDSGSADDDSGTGGDDDGSDGTEDEDEGASDSADDEVWRASRHAKNGTPPPPRCPSAQGGVKEVREPEVLDRYRNLGGKGRGKGGKYLRRVNSTSVRRTGDASDSSVVEQPHKKKRRPATTEQLERRRVRDRAARIRARAAAAAAAAVPPTQ